MQQPTDPLDKEIEQHHKEIEAAEQNARAIDLRLSKIPGLDAFLKQQRPYGTVRNPWASGNLTAQGAVLNADRSLAVWLASKAGKTLPAVDYAQQEAAQRQGQELEQFAQLTEQARAQRQAVEAFHADRRINGSWNVAAGKVI